jgi:sec-independent protein translocase protein TatA
MIAPLAMWTPGPLELVVLLVLVMIFFGVGKLPEVGAALGKSIKAFKEGQSTDALDVTPETETIESTEVEVEQA